MFHVKQLMVEHMEFCPLCRSQTLERVLSGKDYLTFFGEFSIDQCRDCSLLFTNPRPIKECIALCYPGSKYQSHKRSRTSFFEKMYFWAQKYMLRRKLSLVKKFVSEGALLLDVGSGVGGFASFMAKRGFRISAIEPSEYARIQVQEMGLSVFEDIARYTNSDPEPPHLISLWHVL